MCEMRRRAASCVFRSQIIGGITAIEEVRQHFSPGLYLDDTSVQAWVLDDEAVGGVFPIVRTTTRGMYLILRELAVPQHSAEGYILRDRVSQLVERRLDGSNDETEPVVVPTCG